MARQVWVYQREYGGFGGLLFVFLLFPIATALLMMPVVVLELAASGNLLQQAPVQEIAKLVGMAYGGALLLDLIAGRGGGSRWWVKLVRPAVLAALNSLLGVLVFEYLGPEFLGPDDTKWFLAFAFASLFLSIMWYLVVRAWAEDQ